MLLRAEGHVYEDLRKGEAYYRLHSEWTKVVFVQPGGLVHDTPKGYEISQEKQHTPLSYLDLAAGMVEIGEKIGEDGTYAWDGVSVVPAKQGTSFSVMIPLNLAKGLAFWYIPFLYGICRWIGFV